MSKVAIVGAGPAGKTAARIIQKSGTHVTVYEKEDEAGGLLRYGYPAERMPDDISRRDTDRLAVLGVRFIFNRTLGRNLAFDELTADYDAVLLAIGSTVARRLGIDGEDLPGVWTATSFQHAARTSNPPMTGHVLVIGGGDTAVDTATTALSLGASSATVAYRGSRPGMRAQEREISEAEDRGVKLRFQTIATRIESSGKALLASLVDAEAETHREAYEAIVVAIGQEINTGLFTGLGLNVQPDGRTNLPGVFIAGESLLGPNRLANALTDGRRAAEQVLRYLQTSS